MSFLAVQRGVRPEPLPLGTRSLGGRPSPPVWVLRAQVPGRRGQLMPGPSLCPSSLLPALSCPLLQPEEMERAGGGPLSSHPPPEPKSGARPFHPQSRGLGRRWWRRGSAWSHCQEPRTLRPPRQGPQPSHSEALPHRLSGHCSGKKKPHRATQAGPTLVPVTLSCHSPEGLPLGHPRLSRRVAGGETSLY